MSYGHDDDQLDWEETAELAFTTMRNGNLTDGVNLIMYDGDVRVDSVKAALALAQQYILDDPDFTDDADYHTRRIIGLLIRLIETWETQ